MAAAGGSDCPPPPPPPPPPNNNNNNNVPQGSNSNSRPDELSDELSDDNFGILLGQQGELNNNLQYQMQMLSLENDFLREHMEDEIEPEPEPEQIQIPAPEDSDDDDLELQGAAAAAAPIIFFEEDCSDDFPEKFDGNPDTLSTFMSQCQIFMERSSRDFSADRIRVCFVTSMLTGRAARWASDKLERSSYLMHNYPAFMMEMKHVFEDPQRREAAKRKIRRLRQGLGSVVDYSNAFQMLAQDLDWNEPALIDQYLEGLSDYMQEALSHEELPKTLSALINQCILIERRMTAAASNKPSPPRALVMPQNHQADPTEPVGGARMRLTQEEKERRRKLNLCLYCGSGGHYADNCPAKASKNSPPGNSPAPL